VGFAGGLMATRTKSVPHRGVRRRMLQLLERHPEFWRDARIVEQEVNIGLPEGVWAFINTFARKNNQKPGEAIAFFAQEYLGIVLSVAQKTALVRDS